MSDRANHADLTPQMLLNAYASGIFPMSDARDDPAVYWVDPRRRGILPLDEFHISHSLARSIRRDNYAIRINTDFEGILRGCADRPETWINDTIHDLYLQLYRAGFAHTMELWDAETLAGGVYGVTLGGAFFGESMFSRRTDASKIALAYLVDRLRQAGFALFDTQFLTAHLQRLGGVEISRAGYRARLERALALHADYTAPPVPSAQVLLQRSTHTS